MSSAKKAEGKFVLCSHISKFTFGFFHRAKPVTEVKRSGTEVHCGLAGSEAELRCTADWRAAIQAGAKIQATLQHTKQTLFT